MPDPSFDPSRAVTFDLAHGLVHLEGAPSRLLVPADALLALAGAAGPEATASFGRALGEAMGRRMASRLPDGVGGASVEGVVEHLGGELALAGLGSMSLERWGRALVLVVEESPLGDGGDGLLEAVLAAALHGATGKGVHALLVNRKRAQARFLIGSAAALDKVTAWLAEGTSWGTALVRLHAPVSAVGGDA